MRRSRHPSRPSVPPTRAAATLVRAAAVLAAALLWIPIGCENLPTGPSGAEPPALRGVTLVSWSRVGYGEPSAAQAIREIAQLGATHMAIVPTGYQTSATASAVRVDPGRTPTQSSVRLAIEAATTQGLRVVLKPHIDLDDGRWRGDISPADPTAWFDSYARFLMSWADLAQNTGVETFVVGTELAGTIEHADAWKRIIAEVRTRFAGRLLYAASWDEAGRVGFWPDLDGVGVDVYVPVTVRTDPGRLEVLAGWQRWIARLRRLHERTGKPLFFTEIGYRSVDGAGMRPNDFQVQAREDETEQADLFWAALEAIGDESWVGGLLWWNWRADGGGGPGDADYTIRAKLAGDELAAAWSRQ